MPKPTDPTPEQLGNKLLDHVGTLLPREHYGYSSWHNEMAEVQEKIEELRRIQREHDAALAGPENAPVAFHQHKEYIRGRNAAAAAIIEDKG